MAVVFPDWCELVRGDGPVLLVAPHGGRRPRVDPSAPPANLKVNDVHTAELTRGLAAKLGATAVINHGCDRNQLDLNRISQVRRRAPWFFELLRDEIEKVLSAHPQAEVLFVHGWNVGQAKCDLGIGAKETPGGLVSPNGGRLTVSRSYLDERIAPLRAVMQAREIDTYLGVRYPASHPNNFLQVFTDRGNDEALSSIERQFAGWARDGVVQALQIELGVPLRWPGVWRERLVDCLTGQFQDRCVPKAAQISEEFFSVRPEEAASERPSRRAAGLARVSTAFETRPLRSVRSSGLAEERRLQQGHHATQDSATRRATSLQFFDPVANIGLMSGIGPIGKDTVAARLLLFLGRQRVALFTGEQTPADGLAVEPLRFEIDGDVTTLNFNGPILHLDDGTEYLDLEAAFAASTLGEIDVQVRFRADATDAGGAAFGRVEGCIDVGGKRCEIAAGAYANAASARSSVRDGHTVLAADFGEGGGLLANVGGTAPSRVVAFRSGCSSEVETLPVTSRNPTMLEVTLAREGTVRATPICRMEILRGLGAGRYARVTFGTAAFRTKDSEGHGLYEYTRLVEQR